MTYISCFSDFAFYFYYYFMENCHTWIIISMWQNDLHTNTSRSVWTILYGLMIKMLQYKMYPAGELTVLRQLLFKKCYHNLAQTKKSQVSYRTIGPLVLCGDFVVLYCKISGSCSEEEGNVAVKVHKKMKIANPLVQSVSTVWYQQHYCKSLILSKNRNISNVKVLHSQ